MPSVVYAEPTPAWVATTDPALPWRVETSQYTVEMADYLDAGTTLGGLLWRFTHRATGKVTTFSPESIAYVDHMEQFDPFWALDHIQAVVSGDTISYDHPQYRVTYQALTDEFKLTIFLKVACRAPNPNLVNVMTAFLSLTGGIALPADLETWDRTGKRLGDFTTHGEVYLKDLAGNVVQFLDRVTARDSEGHPGAGEIRLVTDTDGTRRLYQGMSWGWLQVASFQPTEAYPEGGVEVDPTVVTSTSATATAYSNQHKNDRFANGVLFGVVADGAGVTCRYSADGGASAWQTPTAGATIVAAGTQPSCFIDPDDFVHVVYMNGSIIYHVRGTPDAGRTGYTWSPALAMTAVASANLPTVVACIQTTAPKAWRAFVVWNYNDATAVNIYCRPIDITATGVMTLGAQVTLASPAVTLDAFPSPAIDSAKNVYVTWREENPTLVLCKLQCRVFSFASQTWGATETIVPNLHSSEVGNCALDGLGRLWLASKDSNGNIRVWRRATGATWSDVSPAAFTASNPAIACDGNNAYLFYVTSGLKYRRNTDPAGTWGAEVVADSTATAAHPSLRRESSGPAIDALYTIGSASPYTAGHFRLSLNTPPTKPTQLARANYDAADPALYVWQHNDPDGNPQASRQVQIVRVSTGLPVYDSGKVATATQSLALAANTAGITNSAQYQWRVMTWDTSDFASPWSDYATFYTSAKPIAAITYPATDGATHNGGTLTAQGTLSDPESEGSSGWQWTLTTSADALLWDGLKQTTTSAPLQTVGYSAWTNGASYKLKLIGWDAKGVQSVQVVRTFVVSFTAPARPTIAATPQPTAYPPSIGLVVGNLDNVLEKNQSDVETDLSGLGGFMLAGVLSQSRDATVASRGAASFKVSSTVTTDLFQFTAQGHDPIVSAGVTYTGSVHVRRQSTGNVHVQIEWYDAAYTLLTTTPASNVSVPANTFTRLSVTAAAPSNAAYGRLVSVGHAVPANEGFWWDDAMFNVGSLVPWAAGGVRVVGNTILRRIKDFSGPWTTLPATLAPNGSYNDTSAASGVTYEYAVTALGDNGTTITGYTNGVTTATQVMTFAGKVPGNLNVPHRAFAKASLTFDAPSTFAQEFTQTDYNAIAVQDGVTAGNGAAVAGQYIQQLVSFDLLGVLIYARLIPQPPDVQAMKDRIKAVTVNVTMYGIGANAGASVNGAQVKLYHNTVLAWSAIGITINNSAPFGSSSTPISDAATANAYIDSAGKAHFLAHTTYPSDGTRQSQIFIDHIRLSVEVYVQTTAMVEFTTLWLHDPYDPEATAHSFQYREVNLADDRKLVSGQFQFVGRDNPVVRYDPTMVERTIKVRIAAEKNSTDRAALEEFLEARRTICLRDPRGRLVYGALKELPSTDEVWGGWVDVQLTVVSFAEGV